ncbi:MAG: HAD hydrolase-like protein [Polyangiales bacterium]
MPARPVLLLFDIDGTLLIGGAVAHAAALHTALEEIFGVDGAARHAIEVAGRTDLDIARELLRCEGIAPARVDEHVGALAGAWCRAYADAVEDDLSHALAPGAAELLERLAARADARLSLLTGNLEPIARLKLERAGIGRHFAAGQGAFGSDAEDRTRLPPVARARAGIPGAPWPRKRTLVIGDTPRDIACARADGLRCLAVASGGFGPDELAGADGVAVDAWELARLVEAELGGR